MCDFWAKEGEEARRVGEGGRVVEPSGDETGRRSDREGKESDCGTVAGIGGE
jgi:hypothetical protein